MANSRDFSIIVTSKVDSPKAAVKRYYSAVYGEAYIRTTETGVYIICERNDDDTFTYSIYKTIQYTPERDIPTKNKILIAKVVGL